MNQVDKEILSNVTKALETEEPCVTVTFKEKEGVKACDCGDPTRRDNQILELITRNCDAYIMATVVLLIFDHDPEVKMLVEVALANGHTPVVKH